MYLAGWSKLQFVCDNIELAVGMRSQAVAGIYLNMSMMADKLHRDMSFTFARHVS